LELINAYFPGITERQREQYASLQSLYEHWNAQINVISRKDIESLYEKHVLHSLSIAKFVTLTPGTVVMDIGCGGGFPTIPLAIFFPGVHFTAVDSIGKKIKVVNEIASALGLNNVTAIQARAETVKAKYDFIVSRAVAPVIDLLAWSKSKILENEKNEIPNGFLFLKGGDLKTELHEAHQRFQFRHKEVELHRYFNREFFETKKLVHIHS
jgi:16S rRNA (guanine527-N7)-methyltransferase